MSTDNRTATQRIEDLEKVVTALYQATSQLQNVVGALQNGTQAIQNDTVLIKEALKLINKRTEAIIQVAAPESGITDAVVSALVVKMNVADLTEQVKNYVAQGQMTATDTVAVDSYLVCEELDKEGNVVNPRIQFRLDGQDDNTRAALLGKKVGEVANFGEDRFSAKLLEIYTILPTKAETAPAAAETPAAEAAPAETAPAETAPAAPTQEALPPESTSGFELSYHGQPESTLAPTATA